MSAPPPSSSSSPSSTAIVPAHLGFLAIYNPSLGATDETIDDQIVYYASVTSRPDQQPHRRLRRRASKTVDKDVTKEDRNERLRQIGLAQGMVEFGKSFSGGKPVDTIDTEKSRVVLRELEPGWWILASINLTRLPLPPGKATAPPPSSANNAEGKTAAEQADAAAGVEYSSREVKPAALLLQDLLRAHSIFLLHHASSLSALFVRSQRAKFASILGRYWDMFLSTWNVLLHGNPARNIFGGIKIAACGELGIGVGEEERGSGEREVLEGLVGRVEGLVDLIVGKFGDAEVAVGSGGKQQDKKPADAALPNTEQQWLGTGNEAGSEDGAIFLGVGALSRHSLRDITYWMEDLYSWGENAYGVIESPTATRTHPRKKRTAGSKAVNTAALRQSPTAAVPHHQQPKTNPESPGPPPPVYTPNRAKSPASSPGTENPPDTTDEDPGSGVGMDKFLSYLKLGYGTSWSVGGGLSTHADKLETDATGSGSDAAKASSRRPPKNSSNSGHYLIGLMGDVEESGAAASSLDEPGTAKDGPSEVRTEEPNNNSRTLLRTLTVELEAADGEERPESQVTKDLGGEADTNSSLIKTDKDGQVVEADNAVLFNSQDRNKTRKLRVVVYVSRPFIFIFLFQLHTDSLAWEGLYKSLHHQLSPLRNSLLNSTTYRPGRPDENAQIYDLIWDPRSLTVHSTIPNIPDPNPYKAGKEVWTRLEALNTHNQILNMLMTARQTGDNIAGELERTCKTSRGWWIVWSRILEQVPAPPRPQEDIKAGSSDLDDDQEGGGGFSDEEKEDNDLTPRQREVVVSKEIVLIRKASDHSVGGGALGGIRGVSASYAIAGGNGGWADGASRLAQGIGVDTRRYIEGLLSLNR
ncbi:hypothetical protein QBC46DRAFT_259071 [Diplogelasinospora grovesii]|uniref:CCZ1/INTU/HSP4 first Longin domain-containing protein n=1 Tax=Diplogelasinospora grovesii TaxID=303347 RepID=A0AAN6N9F1_9PEZI|nr:hypothetical protein QBC46DRAFT_259071 [Diplogelasinospora grovesii]